MASLASVTRGTGGGVWRGILMVVAISACNGGNSNAQSSTPSTSGGLTVTTVASGFDTLWELAWGPDGAIWVTERKGTISRVDPATGAVTRAGVVSVSEVGEGGLMGLAFHPAFSSQPFVYATHTYRTGGAIRNRLVRMRWDGKSLGTPQTLVDDIPGDGIHNGSRVVVGPDGLLYVTTGDAGDPERAQDKASLAGKILRVTLEGAPAPGNPLGTRMFTFGHRNPQGLVFLPNGSLYSTEHGPGDNDELNRIEMGRNYGWPNVRGKCDGDAGPNEQPFCQANDVAEPLAVWTPTIALTGLTYYDATLIPGWRGSLLFTSLTGSALHRVQLSADDRSVGPQSRHFEGEYGRLRDVLVGPDGTVYLATSNRDGRGSPGRQDDRILRVRP